MVLPLIPLALIAAGVGTGTGGIAAFVSGGFKVRKAKCVEQQAEVAYLDCLAVTRHKVNQTNGRIRRYGRQQGHARRHVVVRMADFLRRNQKQVSQSGGSLLDGIDVDIAQIPEFEGVLTFDSRWMSGAVGAVATGAGAYVGLPALAGAVGTASTGATISGLSGAAAQSATMAWLGGGSIAAGGGGVALGATALNFVTIGPALLVSGLVFNGQGEKSLTRAQERDAEVQIAIEQQVLLRGRLDDIQARVRELSITMRELVRRAQAALYELEQVTFDPIEHAELFRRTMRLVVAVRDFCLVPILDDDGALNTDTEKLVITYREFE